MNKQITKSRAPLSPSLYLWVRNRSPICSTALFNNAHADDYFTPVFLREFNLFQVDDEDLDSTNKNRIHISHIFDDFVYPKDSRYPFDDYYSNCILNLLLVLLLLIIIIIMFRVAIRRRMFLPLCLCVAPFIAVVLYSASLYSPVLIRLYSAAL